MERAKLLGFLLLVIFLPGLASSQEGTVIRSFDLGDSTSSVAMDSIGSVVVAGKGKEVLFFNGSELNWTFQCHYTVKDISISGDGRIIYVADRWLIYRLNETGGKLWEMKLGEPHRIDSTLNGDRAVVASLDKKGYLVDLNGSTLWTSSFSAPVIGAGISPEGKNIAYGRTNGKISLYNDKKQKVWEMNLDKVIDIIDIKGDEVLVGEGSLKFIKDGEVKGSYLGLTGVSAIDVSSDGSTAIVGSEGGDLVALGADRKSKWKNKFNEGIEDVYSSSNGSRVAVASGNRIYLLSSPGPQEVNLQKPAPGTGTTTVPPSGGMPVASVQVNITSPSRGEKIYGIVPIKADFSSSGILTAVFIDGNYACTLPCQWDTSGAEPGEHEITVRALSGSYQVLGEEKIKVSLLKRPNTRQNVVVKEEISSTEVGDIYSGIREFYVKYEKLIILVVLGVIIMGLYEKSKKKNRTEDDYRYRGF